MLAYHFIAPDLKTRFDNLQAKVGEVLEVAGEIKLCNFGLHASVHPWDALLHAQTEQTTLCLVELSGKIIEGDDKVVASKRKILKTVDAKPLFQRIALFAAKEVLPIFEKKYPDDKRVRTCIEVTERYLKGKATKEELEVARSAAYEVVNAASAAGAAGAASAAGVAASAAMKQNIRDEFQRMVDEEFAKVS